MKTTKRLLALLLSVLMLLGVCAVAAVATDDALAGCECPECGFPLLAKNLIADYSCKEGLKKNYYIYYCETCDDGVYVYLEEAAAHTWEVKPEVPATCKDTGMKSGKTCTVCGKEEGFDIIPVTDDHKMGDDGYCTVCGKDLLTDRCPYCHQQHGSDFGGRMTRFFHNIANFCQNMFNR